MTLSPNEIRGMWRAGLMRLSDAVNQLVSKHQWNVADAKVWLRK